MKDFLPCVPNSHRWTDETPWAGGFTWLQQTASCLKHSFPPSFTAQSSSFICCPLQQAEPGRDGQNQLPIPSSAPLHANPHFTAACLSFPAIREQNTTGLTFLSCFTILPTGRTVLKASGIGPAASSESQGSHKYCEETKISTYGKYRVEKGFKPRTQQQHFWKTITGMNF